MTRSYAFVIPRFWPGIAGGAETLVGQLAQQLAERGDNVEILTTCAKDNRTWENDFEPGSTSYGALKVTRFPVDARNLDVWIPLQIAVSQGLSLSVEDELTWMAESVNSRALYATIAEREREFDQIFFAPYLFGTTFWGSGIAPQRSCLIPCLHDEQYAYTQIIGSMFRQVRGALFNAVPEMELAEGLYGRIAGGEVGMGFDLEAYKPEALTPYFEDDFPYVLYLGRKETGKNADVLVDLFIAAKESGELSEKMKLVIAGGGSFSDLHRPQALLRPDIIDLPHLSEIDKQRVVANALTMCQPSTNESFSIVLMEGWLLGTPGLVHAKCAVTRRHVVDSGGGLYFSDALDFAAAVGELERSPKLRQDLARAGAAYVRERYNWTAVLERFDAALGEILKPVVVASNDATIDTET